MRLGLASVWLISGVVKLFDPGETYLAVQAYQVLPAGTVGAVATALPLVELVLGLLLVAGLGTRAAAVASAVLLLVFIAGVTQAWARGLSIDCGCFGGGGEVAPGQTNYPKDLALDIGYLVLACWLVVRPRSRLALDGALRGGDAVRSGAAREDRSRTHEEV